MGAKISKEPIEAPGNWPPDSKAPFDDPFPIYVLSPSRFFCQVQQAALWTDYFVLHDQRIEDKYKKQHIATAKPRWQSADGLDWAWDVSVLIYGDSEKDEGVKELVDALIAAEYPPSAVYVLQGPVSAFLRRYKIMRHKMSVSESLPGPVELVPPTPTHKGCYAIHRVHFMRSKGFTARLNIGVIINISARRLFVKTPGIHLENTSFNPEDPTPEDFVVVVFCKYANEKVKKKGKQNILIIDEPGCDYATILAGWHLYKHRNIPLDDAIESVTMRNGFLDTWYADVITSWAESY